MAEQHQLDKSDWEAEVAHLRKRLKEEKANAKQAEDRAKATAQQLQQLKLQCVDGVVVAVLDLGGARERGEICGCILALTYSFPLSCSEEKEVSALEDVAKMVERNLETATVSCYPLPCT